MDDQITPWRYTPLPARRLDGSEPVAGGRACVIDFWRWSSSDLRDNVSRGVLAEWLVGLALGCVDGVRSAWSNHDLVMADGTSVEVKSAAYLQAWATDRHSTITFRGLLARTWDEQTNLHDPEPSYRADVYVFAVLTTDDHDALDPLDVDQWQFWVASREAVAARGCKSLSLASVKQIATGPVAFTDLSSAVARVVGQRP